MAITVDIHAHHVPTGLPDMGAATGDARWPRLEVGVDEHRLMRGDEVFRVVRPVCFDPGARLAELDAAGVDVQVLSPVPVTLVDWAPASDAARFLRAQNEALAAVAADSGGRFLALGAVPLQDVDLALAELAHAMGPLGMAGIETTATVAGRELDDEALAPFWAAVEQERVPVFIHPAHQRTAIRRSGQPYEFGVGMLTDTALAAAALVYGGVLDRHPDLRIALSHGCGAFPWVHPRLRYMAERSHPGRSAALDEMVRSLWADCLVFDPAHVRLLVERFGADHLLYGTDHPFLPEGFDGPRQVLDAAQAAGAVIDDACLGANALRFLGPDADADADAVDSRT
ncbi:MAG: amidohydrolase family protein [Acidimicrobiales bacterium]